MRIVAADEFNEIDRAAGMATDDQLANQGGSSVSLVTPAHAARPGQAPRSGAATERAWSERLYDTFVDGLLTAALAIRALFY
jgi:hypothetical protein